MKKDLEYIKDFLKDDNKQMVIATYGEHPWIATVYFSFDQDLNLYFLSDPDTIHCQHIMNNPNVAVAIAKSPQNPSSKKKGLQIFGIAEQLVEVSQIKHALDMWRSTLGVTSDKYTYEGMIKNETSGRMFKVVPKKIKFFNEEIWDDGKEFVIEL